MAKRKQRERVTVEGFTWELFKRPKAEPIPGTPAASIEESWRLVGKGALNLWEIPVRINDFGDGDDEFRSGWRVVAGAPEKERYETRDEAMRGAVKTIEREIRIKLDEAHRRFKHFHDMAKEAGAI